VHQSKNGATENEPLNDVRHQKLVDIAVDHAHDWG